MVFLSAEFWQGVGGLCVTLGLLAAIFRRPTRWVFRRLVVAPVTEWNRRITADAVDKTVNGKIDLLRTEVTSELGKVKTEVAGLKIATAQLAERKPDGGRHEAAQRRTRLRRDDDE